MSEILLSSVTANVNDSSFTFGSKVKAAGYYRRNVPLHTVVYSFDNFVGTVKLQATLVLEPGDDDWFDITGTEIGGDSSVIAAQAPYNRTFTGNFVWIRAAHNVQQGSITQILYNY